MKRICLEWGALTSAVAAFALLLYCSVSFFSDAADFQLSFGGVHQIAQMSVARGKLILCDDFANLEVIEAVKRSLPMNPAVASDLGWTIPGFTFRRIKFDDGGGAPIWSLNVSLLIPSFMTMMLAGFCYYRFRVAKRTRVLGASNIT